jgi:hypothetical protein
VIKSGSETRVVTETHRDRQGEGERRDGFELTELLLAEAERHGGGPATVGAKDLGGERGGTKGRVGNREVPAEELANEAVLSESHPIVAVDLY